MIKRILNSSCTYPRSQYKLFILGFLCWLQWSQCSLYNGDWKQDLANWLQSFSLFDQGNSMLHWGGWRRQDWALFITQMWSLMQQKYRRQCTYLNTNWETNSLVRQSLVNTPAQQRWQSPGTAEAPGKRDLAAGGWTKRRSDRLGSSVTAWWPWCNGCNLRWDE